MPTVARVARACATGVLVLAALALVGWAANLEMLFGSLGGNSVMLPNTAVGFLLGGAALWLRLDAPAPGTMRRRASQAAAAAVLLFGAAVLTEWLTGRSLGIDLLLFPESVRTIAARFGQRVPGRMALNSCTCFMLAGMALLALDVPATRRGRPAEWCAGTGLVIATAALVGHFYGVRPLYALDQVAGMALATAATFSLLFTGAIAARPADGVASLLAGSDVGAVIARRLLGTVVVVPLGLGWVWLTLREHEILSRGVAVALFVVAVIVTLAVVVLLGAAAMRRVDRSRERARQREVAARAAAEAASRAKSDFLAVMSHELRTPLNAILGYEELIAEGLSGPVTDLQARQLARIRSSASHLVGLIDEILTLSRIEAGREIVYPEPVDVALALDDAASMAAPQAALKGLTFGVRAPAERLVFETDPAKLRQILVNLLSNAVKFTERGEVALSADVEGGQVWFRVRDTGIGIEAEHLERIFEPFWQIERRTSRRPAGTGLGLDVSRRLAELLGGELSVQSMPGEGSTFTLRLPV